MSAGTLSRRLSVADLTIKKRGRILVDRMTFSARAGELTWVTGENGAGKSTLLRALAGRAAHSGRVQCAERYDVLYYAPDMDAPQDVTVGTWRRFNHRLLTGAEAVIADTDSLVPHVSEKALLTNLSTGERKRLMLWSLLRTPAALLVLDEPYEHLSPSAKARVTEILLDRARFSIVIVATNQEVPAISNKQVLVIE